MPRPPKIGAKGGVVSLLKSLSNLDPWSEQRLRHAIAKKKSMFNVDLMGREGGAKGKWSDEIAPPPSSSSRLIAGGNQTRRHTEDGGGAPTTTTMGWGWEGHGA